MNLNWNQLIWNIIRPPDYLETKRLTNVTPAMKSLLMLTLFTLKGIFLLSKSVTRKTKLFTSISSDMDLNFAYLNTILNISLQQYHLFKSSANKCKPVKIQKNNL